MSKDEVHGGGDWSFTKCLWSPTRNVRGTRWRYWDCLQEVKSHDVILHLRGEREEAAFVGYSTADSNGIETTARPPNPGDWGYAKSFYRVTLRDFVPFSAPINLYSIFAERDAQLRSYFLNNKDGKRRQKRPVFFVIQNGKLQCLNGAYFSEVDSDLMLALFGLNLLGEYQSNPVVAISSTVREQIRYMMVRIGQRDFSSEVRKNFGNQCCFPGCSVDDAELLVGAHIARWADDQQLRGETSNGLCLCLMHDKAFEEGWFTLDADLRVVVSNAKVGLSAWATQHIVPYAGQAIAKAKVRPGFASIQAHWRRTGFHFD